MLLKIGSFAISKNTYFMKKDLYGKQFSSYLQALSSKSSAPGGGSAGALSSALGVSLIQMAIQFSLNDKNRRRLTKTFKYLDRLKLKMISYIDLDGHVFNKTLKAKGAEKKKALLQLDKITFDLGKTCIKIVDATEDIKKYIKKNISSDLCIGLALVRVALFCSVSNLEANNKMFNNRTILKR